MTAVYNFSYFIKDVNRWDTATEAIMGLPDICPTLPWFTVSGIIKVGLTTITQAGGWGSSERQFSGMAYLLLAPMPEVEGEKKFGLTSVWVHPNQNLLSMEEAAKKLTLFYQFWGGPILTP